MARFISEIQAQFDGFSVKDYLRKVMNISSRQIKKLKANPIGILIDGNHAIVVDTLHTGDVLEINSEDDAKEYELCDIEPDIVFEDDNYIVVNKPYNMTVYLCGNVKNNLLSSVCGYYARRGISLTFRPFYRLDKDTSGLVILAKNAVVMNSTKIEKEYYAVCQGKVPEKGVVCGSIKLRSDSRIVREVNPNGDYSLTNFERLGYDGVDSLISLKLETGRTHQIRVHMSYLGYPLCGDDLYGGGLNLITRQALHCKKVKIYNSLLDYSIEFDSDYPEDFISSFPALCK